jgi:predicted transcriptional regulator
MSRLLSVSIPDELMREFEQLARARGTTRSELAREALRSTVEQDRWTEIFGQGKRLAAQRGVGPEDVEALIDEVRAETSCEQAD